ncbi:MAG: PfkB family carbohydrate kinase [Ilumatobacteraceae bacterium]
MTETETTPPQDPGPDAAPDPSDGTSICIFSPTPLFTVTLESTVVGGKDDEPPVEGNQQLHLHVGGQGVWVGRMAHSFGATVTLCAPFGGETGQLARLLAEREGFHVEAIDTAGWTGAYVHDRRGGERVELLEVAPQPLSRHEVDDLYSVVLANALRCGTCIICGTHEHRVFDPDLFRRLAADLHSNDVAVVADLSGEPLRALLEGKPFTVKISHEELIADGWAKGDSTKQLLAGVDKIHAAGAERVVLSRAGEPAIASIDGTRYEVRSPTMEVVDARGAGDSMTAALGVAAARRLDVVDALRLAGAAGAATVTRHGLATGKTDAVMAIAERVEVVELARPAVKNR